MSENWRIKAKVTRKYPIKHWSNHKTNGKVLTIDLIDKDGSEIQAAFFNDAAEKFDILEGKTYLMSGGKLKIANKKFTTINHDYQI